ncbi:hypothetical protein LSAT2_027681, partial [Lamellibrachia satsuma]
MINLSGRHNARNDTKVFTLGYTVLLADMLIRPEHFNPNSSNCDDACLRGGRCHRKADNQSYFCSCAARFTGHQCGRRGCHVDPCKNGGTCMSDGECVYPT